MLSLIFRGYVTGSAVPPWDFMGGGHVETFRWYEDGSFFQPPTWFPYAWFGLPEHQLVQNGGWVLPIAFVAEILGWSPRNAALVQLFYIWLGGVGAFVLGRVLRWGLPVSFLVGFAYLFSVMNFSNAQHSAMLRAATLLPLVVAALLPNWLLKSPYLVTLSGVVVWQLIVSSYPGNLVAISVSILGVVVLCFFSQDQARRWSYLARVGIAAGIGGLLAAPRWLPVALDRSNFPIVRDNTAALTLDLLPTLVSSFDLPGLPNDVTMRSIWLAPICLAAVFFLSRQNRVGLIALGYSVVSLLLMSELPGVSQMKDLIPGLRLSTFAISDWRPIFVLAAAVLLGSVIAEAFKKPTFSPRAVVTRASIFGGFLGFVAVGQYLRDGSIAGSLSLYLVAVITAIALSTVFMIQVGKPLSEGLQSAIALGLAMLTFAGALLISDSVNRTWQTDRALSEAYVYGAYFADLSEKVSWPLEKRPARWYVEFPPLDYAEATGDARYNRYWVTGEPSAAGAHNVKFSATYQKIIEAFDTENSALINFLSTESRQLVEPSLSTVVKDSVLNSCATREVNCNPAQLPVTVVQQAFDKQGEKFLIAAETPFRLIQNEPAHFGWQSRLCYDDASQGNCQVGPVSTVTNEALRAWDLPAGDYIFETDFVTPGDSYRWGLFGAGVFFAFAYPLAVSFRRIQNQVDSP